MTDPSEIYEAMMKELDELNITSAELENKEEEEMCLSLEQEDEATGEIHISLIPYIEASKSKTDVFEKLILQDLEDFRPVTPTAGFVVTEELEGDNHLDCERRLLLELSALESAQKEQEERTTIHQRAEREKRQHEQREMEDRRRLRERHLEDQLRTREEAEKILLEELEMTKRASEEKLALELHQQQAVISNLQKQVEEERRAFEEAQEEERRSKELLRHRAATTLQAAARGLLARRRAKAELRRRREEQGRREEQLKRMRELEESLTRQREEEARRREKEAQERKVRRAEYERAKQEERARLERERRTREEEEEEKRREQDEKRKKEEEKRRLEEERRTQEEVDKRREEEERRKQEEEKRKAEEDKRWMEEEEQKRNMEGEREKEAEECRKEEERRNMADEEQNRKTGDLEYEEEKKVSEGENKKGAEETKLRAKEVERKLTEEQKEWEEGERRANNLQRKEREEEHETQSKEKARDDKGRSTGTSSNPNPNTSLIPTNPSSSQTESSVTQTTDNTELAPNSKTIDGEYLTVSPSTTNTNTNPNLRPPDPLPMCLPEHNEEKRLSWMKDCVPWSKLALQNRRKQKGTAQSRRGLRRGTEASSLPPLCPETLLQPGGWTSLQEVTTVILEDLPGCSLSTLAQCPRLQSLTLRRCGLKALDGLSQCSELGYIDVQENEITFVDCEKLSNLRILRLGHNRLTSIHGLGGAVNLDVLELSYNSITRIAGLESVKRLQRLCVDHNQLISTRGLGEVYTLLHLDCSHNHLNRVEGLENCALLNTLDLRANSLTEPPCLNNQVLLRQLFLDDNSLSSLDSLTDCWLPLLQELSEAQNSITQLPSLSDCVSLESLDISHNCLSELRNVCESLRGCPLLRQVHLSGNPLLQESNWRATLLRAVPGLRATSGQETDPPPSPPAGHRGTLSPGSFLALCHAQLQQTHHLQQLHIRKLSGASSPLAVLKLSCHHHTEALRLAEEQRYAHEYGDTALPDKCRATSPPAPEPAPDLGKKTDTESMNTCLERESSGNRESHSAPPPSPISNRDAVLTVVGEESGSGSNPGSPTSWRAAMEQKTTPPESREEPTPDPLTADLKNCRQSHANTPSSLTETDESRGEGGGDESPNHAEQRVFNPDRAATTIQALWRGHLLRKRLASALASAIAECSNAGEDDDFEGLDMDEFVFDEAALETDWLPLVTEDTLPRCPPVSSQTSCPKHLPSQYGLPPSGPTWSLRQAWVAGEEREPPGQRVSPENTNRITPASTSVPDGLSERSEKILEEWGFSDSHTALMMLKRAQRMTSKKPQQKKVMDPMVRLDIFRNCANHCGPVEARKRPLADKRDFLKGADGEAELGRAEQMSANQERTQQWLHSHHGHSESEHFLPEIDPDVLIGGRVQLVASPGYRRLWGQAVGLCANNSSVSPPRKERSPPHRNSWGHAKQEVLSPQRVTSSPSKKERISFRDNPVQMSGGWGGGKKRDKVPK